MWHPGWDPGTEKGLQRKTKEIQIKHGLYLMTVYQYWLINYNKYFIIMQNVSNRENWAQGVW